ncbi:aspartic proteinase-like protein 2 isoform X1 [Prunus yedoensis var. nudiflora]|uniref:Aspartic proteinase-like protein 2 isoform X1 n=1 Tax=Prunus yedoensis var. nudiflora TaxID=2094558 RepID=A0A314YNG8_PRUYE|nr:aspartic proteinase-like protein 2 isoform X1 [Prunus yedoensis var. nudiflora]
MPDPRFQPNSSGTYQLVKCNANCNCDEEGSKCTYKRQYAGGALALACLVIFTASVQMAYWVWVGVRGGAMVLGGMKSPMIWYFCVQILLANTLASRNLCCCVSYEINPKVFDGGYGTVLDSGTAYAYLPKDALLALKDSIMREMRFLKQIPGPDPKYQDICFAGAGRQLL